MLVAGGRCSYCSHATAFSDTQSFRLPCPDAVPDPTGFWEVKISRRFDKMDFNKDGFITRADLESQIAQILQCKQFSEDEKQLLTKSYETAWRRVWSFGVSNSAQKVSRREFLRGYSGIVKDASARRDLCDTIQDLLGASFDMVAEHGEHTGRMTEPQFISFVSCWNLNEQDGRQLFRDLDKDNMGIVTREQYLLAAWQFYFEMVDRKGPGNNFWGLLRKKNPSNLAW